MALVSRSIPNLINGISQQPPEIRLETQGEEQINGLSTLAKGLAKRPGTEHVKHITDSTVADMFMHNIQRDADEEYTMILSRPNAGGKDLQIWDKAGVEIPVKTREVDSTTVATSNTPNGLYDVASADLAYLETTSVVDNVSAITVADTTFLINKSKTVIEAGADGNTSGEEAATFQSKSGSDTIASDSTWTHEGFINVRAGNYSSKFVIDITEPGSTFHKRVGYSSPTSSVAANQTHIGTSKIATYLKDGMESNTNYPNVANSNDNQWDDFASSAPAEGFGGWRVIAGRDENGVANTGDASSNGAYIAGLAALGTNYHVTMLDASGSVIYIKAKQAFTIKTQDSASGQALIGVTTTNPSFAELPSKNLPNNFVVQIVGDADATSDDFYVKYNSTDEVWKECLGPSLAMHFDVLTMPHRLIRMFDDSNTVYFLYEAVKEVVATSDNSARFGWSSRKAGDDDSNPFPSFVGGTINDIVFHKNRLGFMSDEFIILSQAGNYYNFFPISVMTALDASPIDVSVSNNQVAILRHAVAFDESLLLFSDFQQFTLNSGDQALSPATISVDIATQFESTSKVAPVSAGKFVYFPFKRGQYSGVREYFVDTGTASANDAIDITSHVPAYIKGSVTQMKVSSSENIIAVLSDDDKTKLHIYKYYWQDREKLQSSWSHWTFDGEIRSITFQGSTLKLLIKRDSGIDLETLNLSVDTSEGIMEDKTPVLLDRRVKLVADQSSSNIPYTAPDNTIYVTDNARKITATEVATYLAGKSTDVTNENFGAVYAGIPFTFKYEFSRFIHKENELPVQTAKLQIRNINLLYSKTGFFNLKVDVEPGTIKVNDGSGGLTSVTPRTSYEKVFSGMVTNSSLLGQYKLLSGTFKGSVLTNSKNCKIIIENVEYLPCTFQSAEWEGFLHVRSRRI
jgi:hypothetical protein